MLERIQADASVAKLTPVTGVNTRADIAIAPVPTAAEVPEAAVAPVSEAHATTTDADVARHTGQTVGQMRNEAQSIADTEDAQKELEEIYKKVFAHYEAKAEDAAAAKAQGASADTADDAEIDDAIARVAAMEAAIVGGARKDEQVKPIGPGSKDPEPDAVDGVRYERGSVMNKIESALQRVGALRSKLADNREGAHDRLLNITASVTGLKAARAQVDDTKFSVESAAKAYDSIMNNLRAVVVAHGKVSPDIVRLILN